MGLLRLHTLKILLFDLGKTLLLKVYQIARTRDFRDVQSADMCIDFSCPATAVSQ